MTLNIIILVVFLLCMWLTWSAMSKAIVVVAEKRGNVGAIHFLIPIILWTVFYGLNMTW